MRNKINRIIITMNNKTNLKFLKDSKWKTIKRKNKMIFLVTNKNNSIKIINLILVKNILPFNKNMDMIVKMI